MDQEQMNDDTGNGGGGNDKDHGRDRERGEDQGVAMGESKSFEQARDDDTAARFASERTEGGSDQFALPQRQRPDSAATDGGDAKRV